MIDLPPSVAGEMSFAVRAMRSKKRREIEKLEAKNPEDEHLPSMHARLERLEAALKWLKPYRSDSDDKTCP